MSISARLRGWPSKRSVAMSANERLTATGSFNESITFSSFERSWGDNEYAWVATNRVIGWELESQRSPRGVSKLRWSKPDSRCANPFCFQPRSSSFKVQRNDLSRWHMLQALGIFANTIADSTGGPI